MKVIVNGGEQTNYLRVNSESSFYRSYSHNGSNITYYTPYDYDLIRKFSLWSAVVLWINGDKTFQCLIDGKVIEQPVRPSLLWEVDNTQVVEKVCGWVHNFEEMYVIIWTSWMDVACRKQRWQLQRSRDWSLLWHCIKIHIEPSRIH